MVFVTGSGEKIVKKEKEQPKEKEEKEKDRKEASASPSSSSTHQQSLDAASIINSMQKNMSRHLPLFPFFTPPFFHSS